MGTSNRAEALAALAALGVTNDLTEAKAEAPKVSRTGDEVYAGGDEARLLIREAHIVYREDKELVYAWAKVGDTVLLTKGEAKRLDDLGATVATDADEVTVADDGKVTDDDLGKMNAAELVAHVNQHPDDKARVRDLEEARGDKARKSVLDATDEDE